MLSPELNLSATKQLDLSHFILSREQSDEAFREVHGRDLFPYDDDAFLVHRLNEDNRTLRRTLTLKKK